jgi:(1->4)-alpha-D-glucan 1-alpha-D-glucosylmutase
MPLKANCELATDPPSSRPSSTTCAYDSPPEGFQRLHQLLERQSYRLASWRTAADDINWRRFFDINELGGLRVERPAVFEATHGKIFQLIGEGLVDGLRIDHIDGLADPRGYCRKLRRRVDSLAPGRHLPIYVEKILGEGETLRRDWAVDGTTGYEFMNQVSLLQHDPQGEHASAICGSGTASVPPRSSKKRNWRASRSSTARWPAISKASPRRCCRWPGTT